MTWAVAFALLVAAAVGLALPDARGALRRIQPVRSGAGGGRLSRVLAGRPGAPDVRLRTCLGGLVAAGWLTLDASPAALPAAVVVGASLAVGLGWLRPRRPDDGAVARELPQSLELLAACLAAGSPMTAAVTTLVEVSGPGTATLLRAVEGQLTLGRPASDAWLTLAGHAQWGPAARDIARSVRSGTSLVDGLQVHAEEARRRAAARATKAARAVGVRSVIPLMVCFLPAFVLVGVVPIIAGLLRSFLGS